MEDFWIKHRYDSCNYQLHHHYEYTYQVLFLLSGRIMYQVGDKEYEVTKGGFIILNTLEEHTLKVLDYPYERYIFQISPTFFQNEVKYPGDNFCVYPPSRRLFPSSYIGRACLELYL
ncbi:MAG: AraC family ligand binding domain-containing protein [Enterocloster bolteae]